MIDKDIAIRVGNEYLALKRDAKEKLNKGLITLIQYYETIDGARLKLERENGLLCKRVFVKKTKDVLLDEEYEEIKSKIQILKNGCHWNARRISALIGAEVVYGELLITKNGKLTNFLEHSWNRIEGEDFDLTSEITKPEYVSLKRKGYVFNYMEIDTYLVSQLDENEHMEFVGGDIARAYGILDDSFHFTRGEYFPIP